jgi:hypothetical protein
MPDVSPAGVSSSVGVGEPAVPTKYIDNEQVVTTAGTVQRQRVVNPNLDEIGLQILEQLNVLLSRKGFPDTAGNDRVAVQGTVPVSGSVTVSGSLTTAGTVSTVSTLTTVTNAVPVGNVASSGSFLLNMDQMSVINATAGRLYGLIGRS